MNSAAFFMYIVKFPAFKLMSFMAYTNTVAHFRKKFSTLCSLLNLLHHPLVLESGEFFVSRSIFSRLCRVLNVSEGAEFSSPSVYQPITGLLTKSFGGVVKFYVGCCIQQAAEGAKFLSEMGHRVGLSLVMSPVMALIILQYTLAIHALFII